MIGAPDVQLFLGVVDRTEELFDLVLDAAERVGIAATIEELEHREFGPESPREDLVVLGPRELTRTGLRRAARYADRHPACVLVAAGVDPDGPTLAELRGQGIRVAVRGVLTRAKLANALERAVNELDRLRADALEGAPLPMRTDDEPADEVEGEEGSVGEDLDVVDVLADVEGDEPEDVESFDVPVVPSSPPPSLEAIDGAAANAHEPHAVPVAPRRERAAMVTIASATGGCGKTFFATNLAAIVAAAGHRCLLVDLDLQFGEIAAALRIRHPYSVYDGLYDAGGKPLPAGTLTDHLDSLVVHHPLGFDVLTAPRDPALADYVGARDATAILDAVEHRYDVVVVDTPPSLNEVVLTALDRSDVVTVLATLDVPSLKNLTVFLDTLARLRLDRSLLRLVLNKVEPDIGISVGQAQEAFEGRFLANIPLSRGVSRSINAGTVVVEMEPRAAVALQLRIAARAILPDDLHLATPAVAIAKSSPLTRLLTALRPSHRATTGGAP